MDKAHRLARPVAHGNPNADNATPITAAYERHMYLAIEARFNEAGMRLAWLLNKNIR